MPPNNYNQPPKSRRGETLLEVLIALVVLIIGSVTATSLILTSIKANLYNKDALQALNLAQEGIEYMRNLRDTNWIRFSADRQGCWNVQPDAGNCLATNLLTEALPSDSGYALGHEIGLLRITSKLDLSDGIVGDEQQYRLHYYDLYNTMDSDNSDRPDLLDEKSDDFDYVASGDPASAVASSKFYRSINIDYKTIETDDPPIKEADDPTEANMMIVSSKVQWKDGGTVHQVVLTSALTRYR